MPRRRPSRVLTPTLDRNVLSPTISRDGASVLFLLEDDRVYHLARVPATGGTVDRIVQGERALTDYSLGPDGRIAVAWSNTSSPSELSAVDGADLRPITRQNADWLASVRLAAVERSRCGAGTAPRSMASW